MLLSITSIPAAIALFMGDKVAEKENRLMTWVRHAYAPVLDKVMHESSLVLTVASVVVALSLLQATRIGSEFEPNLNEGNFAIQRAAHSRHQSHVIAPSRVQMYTERVFVPIGMAEIASDSMPSNISDGYIMLKLRYQWLDPARSRDALLSAVQEAVEKIPDSN